MRIAYTIGAWIRLQWWPLLLLLLTVVTIASFNYGWYEGHGNAIYMLRRPPNDSGRLQWEERIEREYPRD